MLIKQHVTLSPYNVFILLTACHAILEDLKSLWPYGASSCIGTGVLIVALCNFGTSLTSVDGVPESCFSTGLQNFVISSCWCAAADGLNPCPFNKWRNTSFSSETAVHSSTVNPMRTSHEENVLVMSSYHIHNI